jgi:Ser/Thr protein kinase RdoA (MazF antagonist)
MAMSFPHDVLAHYPPALRGPATPLGNHGGFSGARLFRVESAIGPLCLRFWQPDIDPTHITGVHALMRRATNAGLDYVPGVQRTIRGETLVRSADGYAEIATWMPGSASFHHGPSRERLRTACIALARLHQVWAQPHRPGAPCPAVERRLAVVGDWLPRIAKGWQPPRDEKDPVAPWAELAWSMVRQRLPELSATLAAWRKRPMPQQPCLCDIWHDHVLFTGDNVSGIIDFGSCKVDHIAVDLARLLGSLVGNDAVMWRVGLEAYAQVRPLTAQERWLAEVLDRSGVVVAAANWLRWLYLERRIYLDRAAVASRLAELVGRLSPLAG